MLYCTRCRCANDRLYKAICSKCAAYYKNRRENQAIIKEAREFFRKQSERDACHT